MVIDRYIARSIVRGTVAALVVFAALFFFIDMVRQVGDLGTNNFGLPQAILYVLLNLPQRLYDLAPSTILLGGLISLGTMATGSELVVMRASGISVFRIVRSVVQVGFLLAIMVALVGEFVVPSTVSKANELRTKAMEQRFLIGGINGLWARDGSLYVNVSRVMPDMGLKGVKIFELDENRNLKRVTFAKRALYKEGQWNLHNVKHTEISADGIVTSGNKTEYWPQLLNRDLFIVLRLEPEDMSASDLHQYSRYLEDNGLDASSYRLAYWVKLFLPLTCIVMLLISVPLVLSANNRVGGIGQRVVVGVLLGILFFVFNRAVNNLGVVYGVNPMLSAAIPPLMAAAIAVVLIRRIQ